MVTAALVLAVPFFMHQRVGTQRLPRGLYLALIAGVIFGFNLGLLNSALLLTSATTATLLDNMAPVWVGIGALIFFRERLRARYWLGLAVALSGAAVVTGFNPGALNAVNKGDALAFIGGMFYAAYLLLTQRARQDMDALSYLWPVIVSAAITLCVGSVVLGLPLTGYSFASYWPLIAAGIVSQSGGWLLINYALGHVPASSAVIILLAQPIVTGLLSIPLLGEGISLPQAMGGLLLLSGIYLVLGKGK